MTKKRAERLTGYEIRELPPERGLYTVGAFEGDQLVVKAVGRADFTALRALVHGVLFVHSRKAMKQHGWLYAVPVERATRDPSPHVPVAWWNAPRGEPRAGLPGLPQVDSSG
jgi:hypothetical protein